MNLWSGFDEFFAIMIPALLAVVVAFALNIPSRVNAFISRLTS